jgi:hypothetical protein
VLVQLVNLLNDEFAAEEGTELACGVLRTLAALLAGNDSARKRLSHDVGECSDPRARMRQLLGSDALADAVSWRPPSTCAAFPLLCRV